MVWVGNLPYNIITLLMQLVDHVLAQPDNIADMHFMPQKEMAELARYPAVRPGDMECYDSGHFGCSVPV